MTEPVSLDPLYLQGVVGYEVSEIGYSYLTNYDSDGNIVTDVAREIPTAANSGISPDGKRITYRLRPDVRWRDGAKLTSADVVFTYRAIMNPQNNIPSRYGYDRIASVEAPDPYTVVVKTRTAFSPIIAYFFGGDSNYPILPAHLLAQYASLDHVDYNAAPVGSGPYAFGRWRRADGIDLAPYPQYHLGKPRLEGISLRFIPDSSTVINQLATGEIDAAFFVDAARIDALRAIPDRRIVVTPVPFAYALDFNLKDPLVGDLAVRRGFALAIDRRTLVQKVSHGLYVPDGLRAFFTWAYDARAGNVPYEPTAAAAALQKDGWFVGEDGIRTRDGRRLEIQLAEFTGSQEENEMATVIAAQERAVGIDVIRKRYTLQEFKMHTGPVYSGHYQIALEHQQLNWDPDPSASLACNQWSPGGFNNAMYCDPAVDRAIAHATKVFDRASRARDYSFIQRQMLEDLPYYFLCQVSEIDVIPTRLEGYDRPLLSPFTSIARWHYAN